MQKQPTAPVSIIESRAEAYQRQLGVTQSEKRTPTMFLVFMFSILVIIGTVVAMVFLAGEQPDNKEAENFDDLYAVEDASMSEKLNENLAEEVRKSPYVNYSSSNLIIGDTESSPQQICDRLGVTCSAFVNPENIPSIEKISPINSNGLNYYLEQGKIIVIKAIGEAPYSAEGKVIVVYAGYVQDAVYAAFDPSAQDFSINWLVSRTELFSSITGAVQFYAIGEN